MRRIRNSMVKQLKRFILDENGAEVIEYAVVTVILLLSTGLILSEIYDAVLDVMVNILEKLQGS
jgi:Flp pilus assembly pilin Flp